MMATGFHVSGLRRLSGIWIVVLIGGCAAIGAANFERLYGKPEPRDRIVQSLPPNTIDYWSQVKPIVASRCVVCHGCYDAPCQLKMSSIEGIERGANPHRVYDQARLKMAPLTRLFEDAQTVQEWRAKDFHPILNEYVDTPQANREASVMYRMLQLKQQNPLPPGNLLPDSFSLELNRKQVCTKADEFDKYADEHALWGMPYALPGLQAEERDVLMRWVEQGAVYTPREPLAAEFDGSIDRWEQFLNGSSLKERLVSRYIYEHLSYAHLYFPEQDELQFFYLVRSSTPPGEPIDVIATRRPYDSPGVEPFYYRLRPIVSTIVEKTHMPYALDEQRMQSWRELFFETDYRVTTLPPRDAADASNPFKTFSQLPVMSRYRFMLDEAQFTIMAFIKGPVCRGEIALDVIDDHFWVFFINPDDPTLVPVEQFLAQEAESLELPATTESIYRPIHHWHQYRDQQAAFLARKDQYLEDHFDGTDAINLGDIWYGNGDNSNAALTIYRHFDNATVEKGLLGRPPKTAWVIDYTLLERIHYLLVVGYDVYGNVGHQLDTRLYMSFLRMEGESNFLAFLPEAARVKERNYWYRDVDTQVKEYVSSPTFESGIEPAISYKTADPKLELYGMLRERLADVLPTRHEMKSVSNIEIRTQLERLTRLVGTPATLNPESAFLQVNTSNGRLDFTLLRNTAYANMTAVFGESKNRLPAEDTLSIIPGFIGAYPNTFYVVDERDIVDFVDAISTLKVESDYSALMDSYGVRRTNPDFWLHSDRVHASFRDASPVRFGMFDYNRLDNR